MHDVRDLGDRGSPAVHGRDRQHQAEPRYRMLTEAAQDIIFVVGRDGTFQYVNSFAAKQLGCRPDDLIGQQHSALFPDETGEQDSCLQRVFETGEPTYAEHRVALHTREAWLYTSLAGLRDDAGSVTAVLGISRDVTELVRMREELRALSLVDDLTGLYNRRAFSALAQQQLRLADRTRKGIAVLIADLDGLKRINDTFGHLDGDRAIVAAARVLKEAFRQSDIVARIGGDEFAVLAIGAAVDHSDALAARIRTAIDAFNSAGETPHELSISFGIAYYDPSTPASLEELLATADELMYREKQEKRGQ